MLEEIRLFKGMTADEREAALKLLQARERAFEKGELLLSAGEPASEMGLVLHGSVSIENNDLWGNRVLLGIVEAGEFFAETYAMLSDVLPLVDVRANEDCRVLFLRLAGLSGGPGARAAPWALKLALNLLVITAEKNLHLSGRSFHTAPKTARGRIMAFLDTVSRQRQAQEFDIPFDRQQMADYLNLDRSALSKELGKMRDEGLIRFRKNHFEVRARSVMDGPATWPSSEPVQ